MSELWPDVDGDAAQRSFDTTLHRLRKIMGDDRVLVLRDGKLSLDGRYCRVDVWAFERLLGQSQRLLMRDVSGKRVFSLATRRLSEGMTVYRRCSQVLSIRLGLQPEPETESLYRLLRDARLEKLSA